MSTQQTRRQILKEAWRWPAGRSSDCRNWNSRAGAGRNSSTVHGHPGERKLHAGGGPADIRHSQDRWPVYAEGPVLHDSTLRASGCRPRGLSIEGFRPRRAPEGAFARRPQENGQRRTDRRFRMLRQRRPLQGLSGNGKWTGVSLKAVLDSAGVKSSAREFVFFGADHGEEEVEFRTKSTNSTRSWPEPESREGDVE